MNAVVASAVTAVMDGVIEGGRLGELIINRAVDLFGYGHELSESQLAEVWESRKQKPELDQGLRILLGRHTDGTKRDLQAEIREAQLQEATETMSRGVILGRAGQVLPEVEGIIKEAQREENARQLREDVDAGWVDAGREAEDMK